MSVDLDAYFRRVGWSGDRNPTFATLAGLLTAHMRSIPFENLDVLLGRPIRLDLESIQGKLVEARRGGYCFEHTTLFAAVAEALGFDLIRHSSRVVLFSPPAESARTHMFLTVALPEGRFVVDPGFGGAAAPSPIPLRDDGAQPAGDTPHWMARDGDHWILRTRAAQRVDAWVSTLEQDFPVDYAMANHFTASHPSSPFVNFIMMNIFTTDGRVSIMNRDFTVTKEGVVSAGRFDDRAAFRAFLVEHFGFDLPEVERLRVPAIPEWA